MKKLNLFLLAFITGFGLFTLTGHAESIDSLHPDGLITDKAHVLSDETKLKIYEQQSKMDNTKTKPQIGVLTVNSTNGESIDDFTNDLLQRSEWRPGSKSENNGILIVFAKNNGQNNMRIATGTKTEDYLSDDDVMQLMNDNRANLKSQNNQAFNQGFQELYTALVNHIPDGNSGQPNYVENKANIKFESDKDSDTINQKDSDSWALASFGLLFISLAGVWLLYRIFPDRKTAAITIDETEEMEAGDETRRIRSRYYGGHRRVDRVYGQESNLDLDNDPTDESETNIDGSHRVRSRYYGGHRNVNRTYQAEPVTSSDDNYLLYGAAAMTYATVASSDNPSYSSYSSYDSGSSFGGGDFGGGGASF